jgi:hypothetical protein
MNDRLRNVELAALVSAMDAYDRVDLGGRI